MEKIRVVWGDTDLVPDGLGTDGSRSVAAGGSAAILAARRLREELTKAAEALLGAPTEYKDGVFYGGGKSISIGEVVEAVYRGKANLEVVEVYRARSTSPTEYMWPSSS